MKNTEGVKSTGYVREAARQTGLSVRVYYSGKEALEKGEPLSKGEIEILTKYNELIEEAHRKLEALKEKQACN